MPRIVSYIQWKCWCVSQDFNFRSCLLPYGANGWGQSWVRNTHLWHMDCIWTKLQSDKVIHSANGCTNWRSLPSASHIAIENCQKILWIYGVYPWMCEKLAWPLNFFICALFFLIITQKFLKVWVLHWDTSMPAVWSDLWKWRLWGECVWLGGGKKKSFTFQSQESFKKAHCGMFVGHVTQVRHYGSVKWVSTDEKFFFMEVPAMKAFRRLFEYISGDNEKSAFMHASDLLSVLTL